MENKLINFCNEHSLIKQHSEEWHNTRKTLIGGSQLNMVISGYTERLITQKLNSSNISSAAIRHGNFCEPIAEKFAEFKYKTNLIGSNIFVQNPDFPGFAYSPDGLAVIYRENKECIALFEFKCPYSREIKNEIPKQYLPQIKSGLCVMPFCDIGIFIQIKVEWISWENIENYKNCFVGFIGVKDYSGLLSSCEELSFEYEDSLLEKNENEIMCLTDTDMQNVIYYNQNKMIDVIYSELFETYDANKANDILNNFIEIQCTGIICFIISCAQINEIETDTKYLDEYKNEIENINNRLILAKKQNDISAFSDGF